jgi:hypothetical protein
MKAFYAHLVAHLIFFRRNRLIALVALFICFIWAMTLIPSLFFVTARDKFHLIKMLIEQSEWFVMFFAASLAVMTLYYNFHHRCFKMVITKPCTSEIWLAAHFASVLLVAAVLYLFIVTGALILFKIWHIPLQWGVFYVVVEGFLRLVLIVFVLSFLVSVMHPFLAIILMSIANENTFYHLLVLLSAAADHATTALAKCGYGIAQVITYAGYLILPSYSLFSEKVVPLHKTLRMDWGDLKWLGLSFLYTLLAGALFYTLTALALRRRRHT